jgi:photosystem II stability/assembly factor-like uncharacterized protein
MPSGRTIAVFSTCLAVFVLGLAAVAWSGATGPRLIEVNVADIEPLLKDFADVADRGYLTLVGKGEDAAFFYARPPALDALRLHGIPYAVLLEDAQGTDLYLIPKAQQTDRAAVEQSSRVLREDAYFYLVAARPDAGDAVQGLPAKQVLPSPTESGFPLSVLGSVPEARAFAPQTYSPAIQDLVDAVSQTNLYNMVSGLSGEFAVTIGGGPYTILTRYSPTASCKQAAAYLREQFEAMGVATEYDYFNFRTFMKSVEFPVDRGAGWAVGGSLILHTTDQGQTWVKQEDSTSAALNCILMRDNQTGWAVGTDGTILITEDGATWNRLSSPTGNDLNAISFGDNSTGYICGASGTILKSTDGGHTWTTLSSGTTRNLTGVYFVSATQGWVVGDVSTIRKTANGGSSWQSVTCPVTADLKQVTFTNATTGFIVGRVGNLLRTVDGATWQKVTVPVTDDLYGIYFFDGNTGWACGNGGAIVKTVNGGSTWADQSTEIGYQFRDVCFAAGGEGWIVGNAAVMYSLDAGASWVTQNYNVQAGDMNVVATIPGTTHPEEIYIICGHYDDTSQTPSTYAPGADDNATGTIAAFEAARVLKDTQFEATLRFVCFSREEQGLVGSGAYVRDAYARGDSIVAALNFDMIGYVDVAPEDIDVIYNTPSAWVAQAYEAAAGLYVPDLPVITKLMPGLSASDHASFWNYGYPATCNIEDSNVPNPYYHKTTDRVSTIDFQFYTTVVKAAVATLAEMARIDSVTASVPSVAQGAWMKVGPNPGRGEIALEMAAAAGKAQTVKVYDIGGRLVRSIDTSVEGGVARAVWHGDDASGARVSPGIYFFKAQGAGQAVKVVLMR